MGISQKLVVASVAILAGCASMTEAREPANAADRVQLRAEWLDPLSVALADFRGRFPETWRCYTVEVFEDREGMLNVAFGSAPSPPEAGDEVRVTLGDAGRCGPSLTYVFGADGQIRNVRGIR